MTRSRRKAGVTGGKGGREEREGIVLPRLAIEEAVAGAIEDANDAPDERQEQRNRNKRRWRRLHEP